MGSMVEAVVFRQWVKFTIAQNLRPLEYGLEAQRWSADNDRSLVSSADENLGELRVRLRDY